MNYPHRCDVCGRTPHREHCETCHKIWEGLAEEYFKDDEVNTEAVNQ